MRSAFSLGIACTLSTCKLLYTEDTEAIAQIKKQEVLDRKELINEVLQAYPEKARKRRAKHLDVTEEGKTDSSVKSNIKSVPGVMTARGCAYAGSKGVVWGPIKDMVHISHGPVGCCAYSWSGRRNYYVGTTGIDSFGTMDFTSDFQERDIVFGGDKKLTKIMGEIEELFPLNQGISIQSECPIGLIGDDIEAVAKTTAKEIGKPVIPSRCEGFRGVSQSLGHHIANDLIRDWVLNKYDKEDLGYESTPYDVGLIGDYNIGGDAWASRILLEEMGLRVIAQWSGDGTFHQLKAGPKVKMNLLHCYRSMNYIARHMEEEYGVPWMEFNFFGPTKIAQSLRAIAAKFDEKIQENAERVIAKYQPKVDALLEKYLPRTQGKTVMLFVGGLRPRHTIPAYQDLGIRCLGTGYEFGHSDDYKRTTHYSENATMIDEGNSVKSDAREKEGSYQREAEFHSWF